MKREYKFTEPSSETKACFINSLGLMTRTAIVSGIVFLFSLISVTELAAESWQPDLGKYNGAYWVGPQSVPETKPKWTVNIDFSAENPYNEPSIMAAYEDTVWTITGGNLKAFNIKNGYVIWQYKVSAGSSIAHIKNMVFVASKAGELEAYDGLSGKKKWAKKLSVKTNTMMYPYPIGDELYLFWDTGLMKVNPQNGNKIWLVNKTSSFSGGAPIVLGDVVLQNYVEYGAITIEVLYAFDRATGKELWRSGGSTQPLARIGDTIYVRNVYWMSLDDSALAQIDELDFKTGRVLRSIKYPRKVTGPTIGSAERVVINDGYVYIYADGITTRYPLGADPAKIQDDNITVYGAGRLIAGPSANLLFYENYRFGVMAVPPDRMSSINYQGIDNPVSVLHVQGRALIVGQTDGKIMVNDLLTGKVVFVANTNARTYPFIRIINDSLIVQAEQKLFVYVLPAVGMLARTTVPKPEEKIEETELRISVNGKTGVNLVKAIIVHNQIMLPYPMLVNALEATADIDKNSKRILIKKSSDILNLTVNENVCLFNDKQAWINPMPRVFKGEIYLPIRAVSQLLGYGLKWDYASKSIELSSL